MEETNRVQVIKANEDFGNLPYKAKIEKLRVAAYVRVSTETEEQEKSYQSMIAHYKKTIETNKDWIFAGIYADEAVTGTKTDKREEFQRLIRDCIDGKIDFVLAKSISRFARNTLDTIKYVRLLKERGIGVYFDVEKIDTLKDGEFLLTVLSAVAQQEVVNISSYVKKGLKMKMKRGELVGFNRCLGYDYDVETKMIFINEEEAAIVRRIFQRYVEGAGGMIIARELNEEEIKTCKGNQWTPSGVLGIIKNEKYKGDLLQGKTYTVDPISKRRLPNFGEEDRFYMEAHHEAIISEEMFDKAQAILHRRSSGRIATIPGKREKFSRQYAFSCMLECGFCGSNLSRRSWHSGTSHQKTMWQCVTATKKGKRYCPDSKGISEALLEEAFLASYKMLFSANGEVVEEFLKRAEKTLKSESVSDKLRKLKQKRERLKDKRKKILDNLLNQTIQTDIYEEVDAELKDQICEIEKQIYELEEKKGEERDIACRLKEFRVALSQKQVLKEFDRRVFESTIEKVIIGGYDDNGNKDPYKITFIYKAGLKNTISDVREKKQMRVEKKYSYAMPGEHRNGLPFNPKLRRSWRHLAAFAFQIDSHATGTVNIFVE